MPGLNHQGHIHLCTGLSCILTNACNFRCPYCQGVQENLRGTIPLKSAQQMLSYLVDEGHKCTVIGGKPLLYPNLGEYLLIANPRSVERIAISTNGSALLEKYLELIEFGVNDFSISLDSYAVHLERNLLVEYMCLGSCS
jgi:MoaA/NifB/PqqE/SkfB family radical SAM enzyme